MFSMLATSLYVVWDNGHIPVYTYPCASFKPGPMNTSALWLAYDHPSVSLGNSETIFEGTGRTRQGMLHI